MAAASDTQWDGGQWAQAPGALDPSLAAAADPAAGGGAALGGDAFGPKVGEVRFDEPLHAQQAVQQLDGSTIHGWSIKVSFHGMNNPLGTKLLVTNCPPTCSSMDLKDHFRHLGHVAYAGMVGEKGKGKGKGDKCDASGAAQQQQQGAVVSQQLQGIPPQPSAGSGIPEPPPAKRARTDQFGNALETPLGTTTGEVRYADAESASKAAVVLNGTELGGRRITVELDPTDGTKLLVSGVPDRLTWTDLKEHFASAGTVIFADIKSPAGFAPQQQFAQSAPSPLQPQLLPAQPQLLQVPHSMQVPPHPGQELLPAQPQLLPLTQPVQELLTAPPQLPPMPQPMQDLVAGVPQLLPMPQSVPELMQAQPQLLPMQQQAQPPMQPVVPQPMPAHPPPPAPPAPPAPPGLPQGIPPPPPPVPLPPALETTATALVRYETTEEAARAVSLLNQMDLTDFGGGTLTVALDASARDGTKIRMTGLPAHTEWHDLKDFCSQVGQIAFCEVIKPPAPPQPLQPIQVVPSVQMLVQQQLLLGGLQQQPLVLQQLDGQALLLQQLGGCAPLDGALQMEPDDGRGKGKGKRRRPPQYGADGKLCGEVRYEDPAHAQQAIATLHGSLLGGEQIKVLKHGMNNPTGSKLLICGISPAITWRELKEHFSPIGPIAYANC